ncbi:MAG: O-sialoglycoprotein endopeptidase [Clostridiales bacterium]|nr:O-sialoglycoprotein endopeptidase [Clostridiales bacterium]
MRVALGFDTSCYTTSAAAVNRQGEVVAASRLLLPVASGQRGLRQSEAVFAHVRQMPRVMAELQKQLAQMDAQIAAVCASSKPRDGEDSYMPVFTVGLGHASVLSSALNVPLYETSHQRGHIAAGLIGNEEPSGRFVALHLSGGTTELLECSEDGLRLLGGCADLHAGQLVDRVGVALKLPFPAGPALEALAQTWAGPTEGIFPVSIGKDGLTCHFSGVETRAQRLIKAGDYPPERIAAEVYDVLARTVARLLDAACRRCGATQALAVGGVASSLRLRGLVEQRLLKLRSPVKVMFGQPCYSGDNAAGVARIGMKNYLNR